MMIFMTWMIRIIHIKIDNMMRMIHMISWSPNIVFSIIRTTFFNPAKATATPPICLKPVNTMLKHFIINYFYLSKFKALENLSYWFCCSIPSKWNRACAKCWWVKEMTVSEWLGFDIQDIVPNKEWDHLKCTRRYISTFLACIYVQLCMCVEYGTWRKVLWRRCCMRSS